MQAALTDHQSSVPFSPTFGPRPFSPFRGRWPPLFWLAIALAVLTGVAVILWLILGRGPHPPARPPADSALAPPGGKWSEAMAAVGELQKPSVPFRLPGKDAPRQCRGRMPSGGPAPQPWPRKKYEESLEHFLTAARRLNLSEGRSPTARRRRHACRSPPTVRWQQSLRIRSMSANWLDRFAQNNRPPVRKLPFGRRLWPHPRRHGSMQRCKRSGPPTKATRQFLIRLCTWAPCCSARRVAPPMRCATWRRPIAWNRVVPS